MLFKHKPLCYAPFSSIYINKDGSVTACCFNRKDIYGNIYQQKLEEIWNSTIANNLRRNMVEKTFPQGCSLCKEALESGNYYNSGIYVHRQFKPNGVLQNIDFELSDWCNYRCVMCYLHSNSYNINKQSEELIINNLKPYIKKLTQTRFYGGEPLIIPIYKKIWQLIVNENPSCKILLQTNGSNVNEFLKDIASKGNFIFNISIDSIDEKQFASIRKNGNLSDVLHNLQVLNKLSKHKLNVIITPMILNAYELPAIVRYFNQQNIPVFFNFLIFPEKYSLKSLNKEELGKLLMFYQKNKYLPKTRVQLFNWIKWRQFQKQLYWHFERINSYNHEQLNTLSETLYAYLLEKHSWIAKYQKNILITIIKRLLLINRPEDLKNKINCFETELLRTYLERKIEEESHY